MGLSCVTFYKLVVMSATDVEDCFSITESSLFPITLLKLWGFSSVEMEVEG